MNDRFDLFTGSEDSAAIVSVNAKDEAALDEPLRLLIVEDTPSDADLITLRLAREGFNLNWTRVEREVDYLAGLEAHPDLVISDWSLPQFSGLRALKLLRERDSELPFLIVSGNIGEEAAIDAIRQGADDYVLKDRPMRLGPAVRSAIHKKRLLVERRKNEEALYLQSIALNAADNGIVITDTDGTIEWVNQAFTNITGFTFAEAVGKNPRDLYKSGKQNRDVYRDMWQTVKNGQIWHSELINRRKNGSLYDEEQFLIPIKAQDGAISHLVGIKKDISARKQAEIELKKRSDQIDFLYEAGKQFSHTLDLQNLYAIFSFFISQMMEFDRLSISYFDPADQMLTCRFAICHGQSLDVSRLTGVPIESEDRNLQSRVLGTQQALLVNDFNSMDVSSADICPVASLDDAPGDISGKDEVIRSGIILPLILKDRVEGLVHILSSKPAAFNNENLQMAEALAAHFTVASNNAFLYRQAQMEINERKQAEDNLRQSEERFSKTFHAIPDGIVITRSSDNKIIDVNESFQKMIGYDRAELIGKLITDLDFFKASINFEEIKQRIRENQGVTNFSTTIFSKAGNVLNVLLSIDTIILGDEICHLSTLKDVTDRVRAEEALMQSSQELQMAYEATLRGWSNALEMRERETAGHSQRVVNLTVKLAEVLGVPSSEWIHIQRGALLHDIGKMGIPDSILLKPGPLTDDEWVVMHQHPVFAYRLLSGVPYLKPALDIPYCHHERWDGAGYPNGLKGEEIPLAARIFAVIDVWDALSHDRPYRPAWPPDAITRYLREQAGKHFDPHVVEAFLQMDTTDDKRTFINP